MPKVLLLVRDHLFQKSNLLRDFRYSPTDVKLNEHIRGFASELNEPQPVISLQQC